MRMRTWLMVLIGCNGLVFAACTQPATVQRPAATVTSVAAPRTAAAPEQAASCPAAAPDLLQDINATPAGPYFVHHPASGLDTAPTVVFIPGGAGLRKNAVRTWENYLSDGKGAEVFRIVIPYSANVDFLEEFPRTFAILDEVLACYGDDAKQVHLAGVSNGGLAAFALMLQRPERFATLLGAPGEFPEMDPPAWKQALTGHTVFNGVGERDNDWKPEVKETHDALTRLGIDSMYVEFPGQGHSANEGFDKSVLFDFWVRHSAITSAEGPSSRKDDDCR